MKKIMYLFSLLTLTSCAVAFQQIASISSPQMQLADDGHFAYSEDDIVVDYNFWAPSGKMSFVITNNLESDVYVDLGRSFLVVNGITYDYFQNRTYSLNYADTFMSSDGYETSNTLAAAAAAFSEAGRKADGAVSRWICLDEPGSGIPDCHGRALSDGHHRGLCGRIADACRVRP